MIHIEADTFYSRADLAAMLAPAGVDVDHFTARLRARKVFRGLWRGADLLDAYAKAPLLAERPNDGAGAMPEAKNRGNRKRRGARVVDAIGMGALASYRAELKGASERP